MDAQANFLSSYLATIFMVYGCVIGWFGACVCPVIFFTFGWLGWGGDLGRGREGLEVLTATR